MAMWDMLTAMQPPQNQYIPEDDQLAAYLAWLETNPSGSNTVVPPHMARAGMSQGEYDANYLNNRLRQALVQIQQGNPDHPDAKMYKLAMASRAQVRPEQMQSAYMALGDNGDPLLSEPLAAMLERLGIGGIPWPGADAAPPPPAGNTKTRSGDGGGFDHAPSSPGARGTNATENDMSMGNRQRYGVNPNEAVDPVTGLPVAADPGPTTWPGSRYENHFGPDQTFTRPDGSIWYSAHIIPPGAQPPAAGPGGFAGGPDNGVTPGNNGVFDPSLGPVTPTRGADQGSPTYRDRPTGGGFGPAPSQPGNPVIPGLTMGNAPSQPYAGLPPDTSSWEALNDPATQQVSPQILSFGERLKQKYGGGGMMNGMYGQQPPIKPHGVSY